MRKLFAVRFVARLTYEVGSLAILAAVVMAVVGDPTSQANAARRAPESNRLAAQSAPGDRAQS